MFPFLIRQTIFGPKGIENTGKMEMTEIQRYKIALERLKQLSDIRLGKPLLIQTLMGNLRVLHSNHIGYFKYISTKKELGDSINRRLLCPAKRKPAREKFMCI